MKVCSQCLVDKDESEFYRVAKATHLRAKCKTCMNKANKKWREENDARYRQASKAWRQTERGKRISRENALKFIARNPHKRAAHIIVNNAVRDGRLAKLPCEVCGNPQSDAHHDDYSKPLEVVWLCRVHHDQLHRSTQ